MAGLAYIGLLRYLQEYRLLPSIKHFYGVSIGALMGFFFAAGIDSTLVEQELKATYGDPDQCRILYHTALHSLYDTFGLTDKGQVTLAPLKNLYRQAYNQSFPKQSYDIETLTFLEFAKHTGNTFTVVATNVTTMQPVFFSVDMTPHQCVWTAIQASLTIPGLFQPVRIQDDFYVDGFVTCEYPVPPTLLPLDPRETLGVFITTCSKPSSPPVSFADYIFRILEALVFYSKETNQMTKTLTHVIQFTDPPVGMMPLKFENDGCYLYLSSEDIDASITYGYELAYQYMYHLTTAFVPSTTSPMAPVGSIPPPQ
jgi:predicted acylesterase/phospholipase RssA